jgi:hypothetical protein
MFTVIFFISIYNAYASTNFFDLPPSTTQYRMQDVSIPLTMNNLSNMDIRSIELHITYAPDVLTANDVSLTGTVLENQNYIYAFNTAIPGIIYAAFASNASQFTGTGLCLNLDFTVIGGSAETSDLTITKAIVNNQAVSTSEGIFTVAPDAPPSFAGILPQTINEDVSFSTSLTIYDYETNPCGLTLTITSSDETLVPANTIVYTCMSGNYHFSITPVADQNGLATITIIAEDSGGLTASASFDLTVVSVNDAPVISAKTTLSMNKNTSGAFSLTATDIETASCSLGITWQSSDTSILPDNNISYTCTDDIFSFSLTPVENQSGNVTLLFTITDSGGVTEMHTLDITVVENAAPTFSGVVPQTGYEDTPHSFTITVSNSDSPCALNLTFESSDESIVSASSISYTCLLGEYYITYTPSTNQSGNVNLTVTAIDTDNLSLSTTVELTVISINDAPTISSINPHNMNEDESIQIIFTVQDIESSSLLVSVLSADQSLISDSNLILANDGGLYTLTVTPNTYQVGQTDISITASDGTDSTTVTFSITVNEKHYIVSGHVSNYIDIENSALQSVVMTLSGTYSYSTITDEYGNYSFTTVRPGSYTLTASKTNNISLDLADAIKILKGAVKLIDLTCYEKIAADAYIDGYYGAFDASKVARYVGGLENCLNNTCIFWQFIPEEISNCETWPLIEINNSRRYTDLNANALGQDYIGIGCGNVSQ